MGAKRLVARVIVLAIGGALIFGCSRTPAKVDDGAKVEKQLAAVREACGKGDLYAAGEMIVYNGNDESRVWKDVSDYSKPGEMQRVEAVCADLKGLEPNGEHRVVKYTTEEEREGVWHVLQVEFVNSSSRRTFSFLRIGDEFALGDID